MFFGIDGGAEKFHSRKDAEFFIRVRTPARPKSASTNRKNPNTSRAGGRFCRSIMAVSVARGRLAPNRAVRVRTDFFRTIVCLKIGNLRVGGRIK